MIDGLTFDEESHTYRMHGAKVPGVTSVLKPLYGGLKFAPADDLEYKSALGKAVHKAIELHCLNDLDYDSLSFEVRPYFDQYLRFEEQSGFVMEESEFFVYSKIGYAGKCDLSGLINRKKAIIDAKTSTALSAAVALQLAAYQNAHADATGLNFRRYALRLSPTNYHLKAYNTSEDGYDMLAFRSLFNVHNWCIKNKTTMEIQ